MDSLLNSDVLILVLGYLLAQWARRGEKQETVTTLSATLNSRMDAVEEWIDRHSDIRSDFQGLGKDVQGLAKGLEIAVKSIDRLAERFDEWLQSQTAPGPKRRPA